MQRHSSAFVDNFLSTRKEHCDPTHDKMEKRVIQLETNVNELQRKQIMLLAGVETKKEILAKYLTFITLIISFSTMILTMMTTTICTNSKKQATASTLQINK